MNTTNQSFLSNLQSLTGKTLKTLKQKKNFTLLVVTHKTVTIWVESTGKERSIDIDNEIFPAYQKLVNSGEITRAEIEKFFAHRNPVYVAAILAAFPDVNYGVDPIHIFYQLPRNGMMEIKQKSRGASNQQVGRAGEHFVVGELNKRGAFAVPFAGNMPKIDILACNSDESRAVYIQVKTKRGGLTWHASILGSQPMTPVDNETNFWVFVDLGNLDQHPRFWIVPDWWIKDDIYHAHQAYLHKHGGQRASNPDSTHHAIEENRLKDWSGRWEILGIFD